MPKAGWLPGALHHGGFVRRMRAQSARIASPMRRRSFPIRGPVHVMRPGDKRGEDRRSRSLGFNFWNDLAWIQSFREDADPAQRRAESRRFRSCGQGGRGGPHRLQPRRPRARHRAGDHRRLAGGGGQDRRAHPRAGRQRHPARSRRAQVHGQRRIGGADRVSPIAWIGCRGTQKASAALSKCLSEFEAAMAGGHGLYAWR